MNISFDSDLTQHETTVLLTQAFFTFDADKTFTQATVREPLPADFVGACVDAWKMTEGGFMIATNSAKEGLDEMMRGNRLPALVSQGTMCRFEKDGEFILHPDLDPNITTTIDEIDKLTKELIVSMAPEYAITNKGSELHSKTQAFLKPEHKNTCYCIVFQENRDGAKQKTIDIVNKINKHLNLSSTFHIHFGVDAIELVPLDKDGNPFSKWKGLQWVMDHDNFAGRQLIIGEDSNEQMLKDAYRTYNAFNIAVGSDLPHHTKSDYIHENCEDIEDFRARHIARVAAAKSADQWILRP